MARSFVVVAFLVFVLCFSSVLARKASLGGTKAPQKAPPARKFAVLGYIFCDPCHFQYESRLSTPLQGVKMNLRCENKAKKATYVQEGKTDANGVYKFLVDRDLMYKDENCMVKAVRPGKGKCTVPTKDVTDRFTTKFVDNSTFIHHLNPIGFMTKAIDGECRKVAKEIGADDPFLPYEQ